MSGSVLRLFLSGCGGRMGRVIERLAAEDDRFEIVGGADANLPDRAAYPVVPDAATADTEYDVLIDFSHPSAWDGVRTLTRRTGKAAVLCTTGLSEEQTNQLHDLSGSVPVFRSANMSLGINLLLKLSAIAAAALRPEFDIEIVEAHHSRKLDAPSGTAYMLGDAIRDACGDLRYCYDRHDRRQERDPDEIGMHSVRGGSIVGDHDVIFAGQDEIIRLSHQAGSRDVFARGALAAAAFLSGKPAGLYSMTDLLRM